MKLNDMTDNEFISKIKMALKDEKVKQSDKNLLSQYLHINLGKPELKLNTLPARFVIEEILKKYDYL